jgi:hypothetical protein
MNPLRSISVDPLSGDVAKNRHWPLPATSKPCHFLLTALGLAAAALTAPAATINWTNTASGSWGASTNWSPRQVPGAGDTAVVAVNAGSKVEVRLDADVTVAGLTMSGSAHALRINGYQLILNGPATLGSGQEIDLDAGALTGSAAAWVNGGVISWTGGQVSGPLNIGATASLVLTGSQGSAYNLAGTITNAGKFQLASGDAYFRQGRLVNLAGAEVALLGSSSIWNLGAGTESITNLGTLRKYSGTGTNIAAGSVAVPVYNAGTVDVESGSRLILSGGGVIGSGSVFTGYGQMRLSDGTFSLNTSVRFTNAILDGAILTGVKGVLGGYWRWQDGRLGIDGSTLTIAANSSLTLAGDEGRYYDLRGALTNAGLLLVSTGSLYFRSAQLINQAGAMVDFEGSGGVADFGAGSEALVNRGLIYRGLGGRGSASEVEVPFYNYGSVATDDGSLAFSGGGRLADGCTFFGAGTNEFTGGTFTLEGSVNLGDPTLSGVFGAHTLLEGATLAGTNVELSGVCRWTDGRVGVAGGSLRLSRNSRLTLAGESGFYYDLRGALTNAGSLTLASGNLYCRGAQLVDEPDATLEIAGGVTIDNFGSGSEALINRGTLIVSGYPDLARVLVPFHNYGAVDGRVGKISFAGGGSLNPGSTFAGSGDYRFTDGTFNLNTTLTASFVTIDGATLAGTNGAIGGIWGLADGELGAAGSTLTIASNGWLVLAGTSGNYYNLRGALTNAGLLTLASGNFYVRGAQVYNRPGATLQFSADSSIANLGAANEVLFNQGIIRKSAGTGTSSITIALTNTGTLDAQLGTLSLSGAYDLTGGQLNFGIGSLTSFGRISLAGAAALTGTVSANLNNGYVPVSGSAFPVLSYGSRSGSFSSLALPPSVAWQTAYGATVFTLTAAGTIPTLTLTRTLTNSATLAWPLPAEGFVVEFTNRLPAGSAPWPQIAPPYSASSTQAWIVVPTSPGKQFFRLRKP